MYDYIAQLHKIVHIANTYECKSILASFVIKFCDKSLPYGTDKSR